jgi:hypothetical protein
MNIGQRIAVNAWQDHFETFQVGTPIPTNHPPSLKNAPKIEPDTVRQGWKPKDSKKKKKRAKKDMLDVIQKTLNQGRPTMVNHSKGGDPNLWNPPQIADL